MNDDSRTADAPSSATRTSMHIGELAERTGLSHRTIRHYDDVGLLPASRTEGGFRVYTRADLERLLVIRTLKPMGCSLGEITDALETIEAAAADPDDVEARARLEELRRDLADRREKLARNLRQADELLESLQRG